MIRCSRKPVVAMALALAADPAAYRGAEPRARLAALPARDETIVPFGSPITIDGTLSNDEWADARAITMPGGRRILLKHDSLYLHVGVRGRELGWVHVAMLREDRIAIAHASAALGTFEYEPAGSVWLLTRRTGWSVRDTSHTDRARQARADHLREHGWVASTAWMGTPEEREFTIGIRLLTLTSPRIALVYATDEETPQFSPWPAGLTDGVLNGSLMLGQAPTRLAFRPHTWAALVFAGRGGSAVR